MKDGEKKKKEVYDEKRQEEVEKKPTGKREKYLNDKGELVEPRKLHATEKDAQKSRDRFGKTTKDTPPEIKAKAGDKFHNPYRLAGIYHAQVQSLFLLGSNDWHHEKDVMNKMKEIMLLIKSSNKYHDNIWEVFEKKEVKTGVMTSKDVTGRIRQNFRVLQRLGGNSPYAFKLKQVSACIDIRIEMEDLGGQDCEVWYFKLNTNSVEPYYQPGEKGRKGRKPKAQPRKIDPEQVKTDNIDAKTD
jgi:hypothetical protein